MPPAPRRVYALDVPEPSTLVIGKALQLSHPLFHSPYLVEAVIHEVGHLKRSDGRLVLGLNRLVFLPLSARLAGGIVYEDTLVARSAQRDGLCARC